MRRLGSVFIVLLALAAPASASAFTAKGSARQVFATGIAPNAKTTLTSPRGKARRQRATSLGGVVYRAVKPGRYVLRAGGKRKAVRVVSNRATPRSTRTYKQKLPAEGYGYLTTRDGTKLAYSVRPAPGDGPHPTLIEYAGYGYARPSSPQSGIAVLANLLGFTVVDVNMRGTGCSGGAFDYFDRLQSLDGYDVIETVARQSWVSTTRSA